MIDDLLYVMSGVFDFDKFIWDDEVVQKVIEMMMEGKTDYITDFLKINDGKENVPGIFEYAQKISGDFINDVEIIGTYKNLFKTMGKAYRMMIADIAKVREDYEDNMNAVTQDLANLILLRDELSAMIRTAKRLTQSRRLSNRLDWDEILRNQRLPKKWLNSRKAFFTEKQLIRNYRG